MGQKVHPIGFRLGFNKTWRSRWFADKEAELERIYTESTLRPTPDEDRIKALLLHCLEEHYGSLEACVVDERPPAELALRHGIAVNTIYSRKFKLSAKLARLVRDVERRALHRGARAAFA